MIPTLSQVCTLPTPLEQEIDELAAGKCGSVELWLTKVEDYLKEKSPADLRRLLDRHEMRAAAASYQGGLLDSQGAARREAWELLGRRLELCAEIGVEVIVVACDVAGPLNQTAIERVGLSLQELSAAVEKHGLRAALEFQAGAALGNNLLTAAALVEQAGGGPVGLCLDAFHFYAGPSKTEDLAVLSRENLLHVQLCDLADTPRELAADGNRILPGEGDINLGAVLSRLREIEYAGCVSIELMNPQLWRVGALTFGEAAMTALRRLLGQASMAANAAPALDEPVSP